VMQLCLKKIGRSEKDSRMEARTNSMKCFVKWIPLNTHVRANKTLTCLKGSEVGSKGV